MQQLITGANLTLSCPQFVLKVKIILPSDIGLDMTAYLLNSQGKVRGDADMIFYGQKQTLNRSIELIETTNDRSYVSQFNINTQLLDLDINKFAVCATVDSQGALNTIQDIEIELWEKGQLTATAIVKSAEKKEKALILGEVYRYKDQWKFRFVNQGFNGGLKPLSEYFGVEISDQPISPVLDTLPKTPSVPQPKINLNKITLDKRNSQISLQKQDQDFGEIKINLNWNQRPQQTQSGGFFKKLLNQNQGIDLDLGCLFEMKNGHKSVIQALGSQFGDFDSFPFIKLSADDRTGALKEGEWLRINGKQWQQIHRVVLFAFIYEGVPNWAETDAVVTIYVPDQPPIEVRLSEGQPLGMCGIVELVNKGGSIQVQRHVRYVRGHRELDQAFGFGMRWVAGSK
ncbi:TerD family protein [Acinetobacter seifertii]|uniref:TerD family protein n=1 Tax=Acinetobacter seifertii TaxID=1530123 RepID=UPI00168A7811|nr:TerD family protein [Acinetobacter seifertii]QNX33280.1 TerD family protein [Acinetobacter seifertii]